MRKQRNLDNDFFVTLGFNFDPTIIKPGCVLISEPFLADPNFSRTVVVITTYNLEEGAVGFIVNKPTDLTMNDVMDGFPGDGFTFHIGGPVEQETLFFLHTLGDVISESLPVVPGLSWSSNYDGIQSLISLGKVDPAQVRFLGGYSGWSPGQLQNEIKEKSWLISHLTADQIMNVDLHEMWKVAMKNMGPKFGIMSNFPENPSMN